jgi:hypothetical protein
MGGTGYGGISVSMTELETSQTQLFELPRAVVSRTRAKHVGIKDVDFLVNGERWLPALGDTGNTEIQWVCTDVVVNEKTNAAGQAIGPKTATAILRCVVGGTEILTVERKAQ